MENLKETLTQLKTFMSMDELAKKINEALVALFPDAHVKAYFSNSICDSITIRFSKEKKEQWGNGIYENSPYSTCHVWNVKPSGYVLQREHTGMYGFEYSSGPLRPRNKKVCKNETELINHIVNQFKKFK